MVIVYMFTETTSFFWFFPHRNIKLTKYNNIETQIVIYKKNIPLFPQSKYRIMASGAGLALCPCIALLKSFFFKVEFVSQQISFVRMVILLTTSVRNIENRPNPKKFISEKKQKSKKKSLFGHRVRNSIHMFEYRFRNSLKVLHRSSALSSFRVHSFQVQYPVIIEKQRS